MSGWRPGAGCNGLPAGRDGATQRVCIRNIEESVYAWRHAQMNGQHRRIMHTHPEGRAALRLDVILVFVAFCHALR